MWKILKVLLLLGVGAIAANSDSGPAPVFRSDYEYYPEIDGWFKLHRIPAVWQEARLRCQFEGGILASPINGFLLYALRKYMKIKEVFNVFTGIHATFSNGDFFSIEGVPLQNLFLPWGPSEPNNFGNNERCIALNLYGTISDVKCDKVYPYVCYKRRTKGMVVNQCGTTDNEYTLYNKTGSCYKFHKLARTWSRAFMMCAAEGGYLAIPNSQEEAKIMKDIFSKYPPKSITQVNKPIMKSIMHIGFNDWGEHGAWRTIHGQRLDEAGYSIFAPGQPDNSTNGQFCGGMFRSGLLDDVWCNEVGPYMCEKSPDSLTAEESEIISIV